MMNAWLETGTVQDFSRLGHRNPSRDLNAIRLMARRCLNSDDETMEPLIKAGRCKTFQMRNVLELMVEIFVKPLKITWATC
jgi:hypothetical protein